MRWVMVLLGACSFSAPGDADPQPDGAVASCTAPDGAVLRMRATAGTGPSAFNGTLNGPWPAIEVQSFDIADSAFTVEEPGYTDSMSVGVRVIHDGARIYFGIVITDEVVIASEDNANIAVGDAVVLLIDAANDRTGELGSDDHVIAIDASGSFADTGLAPVAGIDVGVQATALGWTIEMGIDKADLAPGPLPPVIGFNIVLVDDDNLGEAGRDALGAWESPTGAGCPDACSGEQSPLCDTTLFGELELL